MKCKICGSECPPDAKICRDCASARKRAFAATVTQPLLAGLGVPSVSAPRFAPKPPMRPRPPVAARVERAPARSEPAPALPLNVVPRSLGVHWLLIGVAIATTIVVLLVKVLSAGTGRGNEDADAIAAAASPPAAVAAATPPPPVVVEPPRAHDAPAKAASEDSTAKAAPGKVTRKVATRPEPAKIVVAPPAAPEPAPATRAPAPVRVAEPPRSDPWQAMNDGLSRCAGEDLFSRIACEQRLRLQYCPNYWGQVPQCPIGPTTDHGQ